MNVDLDVGPIFIKNSKLTKKIAVNRGGTRSGKTMGIVGTAVMWLISPTPGTMWSICRKTLPALKATAYRDVLYLLDQLPEVIREKIHHNKSDLTFTFGKKTIELFSLDDEQKIRSRKRDYLHVVEANEIDFETFTQLVLRTRIRVYLDFNPDDIDIWINNEIEIKRAAIKKDVEVIVSTYLDNPFLSIEEIEEIEYLKQVDEELWQIFGLGQYGKITGVIYKKYTVIEEYPKDVDYMIGLDFGFSADPNGALRVGKENNRLYLDELLYRGHMLNSEIASYLERDRLCVADSAEPKSIEDISRMGYRIIPSVKGKDSVRSGINMVKEYELFVTARSVNLIKELNRYKLDQHGDPIDGFNHLLDPLRYVVQTKYKRGQEMGIATKVNSYNNAIRPASGKGNMVR